MKGEAEVIPAAFSWKDKGMVSPVRYQGGCGSCYVFATAGTMESQYMIVANKTNSPVHYSVQAALDCMSGGCNGGSLNEPFNHFVKSGVVDDEICLYENAVCNLHSKSRF